MFLSLFSSFPNQSPFPTLSIPNSILILSYSFSLSHPFIFCLFFSYFPIPSPFPTLSFFISFSHTFLFFLTFPSFHISSLFLILSYSKSPFPDTTQVTMYNVIYLGMFRFTNIGLTMIFVTYFHYLSLYLKPFTTFFSFFSKQKKSFHYSVLLTVTLRR